MGLFERCGALDDLNPSAGEREGLLGQGGVVLHLDGQLETLAVKPGIPVDLVERVGGLCIALEKLEEVAGATLAW